MGRESRAATVWKLLRNPKSVTMDRLRDTFLSTGKSLEPVTASEEDRRQTGSPEL